ncbi:helix-turn-helix domain-containing protein [uncultured Phenylobacterium sp.]|uniref:helix-turn-helix domain-containing protein n=1 Tax=uncultured Phenylobacterium sp. TaxID=349273 RepID=UPI0025EAFFFC|nr:helix-turn-helix domain-containing protein [uncultured Phenylobacterium sp.]
MTLAPEACRRRREALGLSIYQLSRLAGLEERTVVRFESALVRPRPVTIVALRKALSRAERERAAPDLGRDPATCDTFGESDLRNRR